MDLEVKLSTPKPTLLFFFFISTVLFRATIFSKDFAWYTILFNLLYSCIFLCYYTHTFIIHNEKKNSTLSGIKGR